MRVISSYTSTLTALLRANRATEVPAIVRQLVVGMPATPGEPDLPGVLDELDVLSKYFPVPGQAHHLVGEAATINRVMRNLRTRSWLHLACHAYQYASNPTRSGFALQDGHLTIADLVTEHDHVELAFLTACETVTGDTPFLNEAIFLPAAMQLLGYRHILATMWTVADRRASYIADKVYSTLTNQGAPDPNHAAEALHHASEGLRVAQPADPILWAPYFHIGP